MDRRREFSDAEVDSWSEREIASCRFDDVRHGKRLGVLLEQLSERIGGSIPFACQDWAATKAAYRFFSNARISEDTFGDHQRVCKISSTPLGEDDVRFELRGVRCGLPTIHPEARLPVQDSMGSRFVLPS